MRRSHRTAGFTLIELMMVVALMGVLASIAIPQFLAYQAKSRRSEAYWNLGALARTQQSYSAEKNSYYHSGNSYPDFTKYGGLSTRKMPWDGESQTAYGPLGFAPEGEVFYSYEANTQSGCDAGCDTCFTATAFGDVDGDGSPSALMYVHPEKESDGSISVCPSILFGFGTPTYGGTPMYGQVAVNRTTDEF